MAVTLPPPYPKAPIGTVERDPISQQPVSNLTDPWQKYFRDQRQYLGQVAVNPLPTAAVALNQNAAIGTTTIFTPTQDGIYSVDFYVAIITAAGVSSSAQVVLAWTDQGLSKSKTFTAVTGNTTTTTGSERYAFQCDGGAPVTYSVAYASNPANVMRFNLYLAPSSVAALPEA